MKLWCPLLPTPQKLSMHSLLTAGTLAEPENSTALQKKVLKHYCSSMAPCGSSSLTDLHEVESTCGLVFGRSMKRLPVQRFPSSSLPVGTSLPEHCARLCTQHLAYVTPQPLHQGKILLTFPVSHPTLGCGQEAPAHVC